MEKEIDSKLKIIKNKKEELYRMIFALRSLKGNTNYRHLIFDSRISKYINNKDLAILGDNTLKLIFSDYLYNKKYSASNHSEMNITIKKSKMENNEWLSKITEKIGLIKYYINLFPTHDYKLEIKDNASFLEAVIGAFYLYFGFEVVKEFILKNIKYFTDN